jgi:hypothetical protein
MPIYKAPFPLPRTHSVTEMLRSDTTLENPGLDSKSHVSPLTVRRGLSRVSTCIGTLSVIATALRIVRICNDWQ